MTLTQTGLIAISLTDLQDWVFSLELSHYGMRLPKEGDYLTPEDAEFERTLDFFRSFIRFVEERQS